MYKSSFPIFTVVTLILFLFDSSIKSVQCGGPGTPSLQLEAGLTYVTNVLEDRNYERMYDESGPSVNFKGKKYEPSPKLDQGIVPLHYSIFIRPILDDTGVAGERFTAPGIVKILFRCERATKDIFIHAVEITIQDQFVSVRNIRREGVVHNVERRVLASEESLYKITVDNPLEAGQEYQLTIAFTSLVSNQRLSGLYLSNYTDPTTKQLRYTATTQFESVHARKAFPCFDEPHLKATFDVSIGRKVEYNSISNMDIAYSEPIVGLKGWVWDHYNTTVKMSTYLLAFIVSDYTSVSADLNAYKGKPVRVWVKPSDAHCGLYAAGVAAKALSFFDDYFQVEYPLPKMDSVALPNEHFLAGAMENYGANTYRSRLLLHTANLTTESERYKITSTVNHELAHQNFGNLVTCKHWNSIWLNEAFATYVSYLGVEKIAPEFKPRDYFYRDSIQVALKIDSGRDIHPVVNRSDINSVGDFDQITYKKGSSLIFMMESFIGKETLQTALRSYLRKHSFGNVLTEDLFTSLDEAVKASDDGIYGLEDQPYVTVQKIMESYIYNPGFPLIRVRSSISSSRPRGKTEGLSILEKIIISQERFHEGKKANDTIENAGVNDLDSPLHHQLWWVPLSIKTSFGPASSTYLEDYRPNFWMSNDTLAKQWPLCRSLDEADPSSLNPNKNNLTLSWLLVNPVASGYNRVLYDDHLTLLLQRQLVSNPNIFTAVTRAKLIDDYFNAAKANYVSLETALGFTTYLDKEMEYVSWTTVLLHIKHIYNMLRSGPSFQHFSAFFTSKLSTVLDQIGIEQKPEEKGVQVILRANLLDWACNLEYGPCLKLAEKLVDQWINSGKISSNGINTNNNSRNSVQEVNPISPDLQPVVYCSAVSASKNEEEVWQFLWKKYQETECPITKYRLISALTCSRNPKRLSYLIEESFTNGSKISKADTSVVLQRIAASTVGSELVLDKIKKDFKSIFDFYGNSTQIGYVINTLGFYWNQESQLKELKGLIETHKGSLKFVEKLVNRTVNIVEDNIEWMQTNYQRVGSWLETKVKEQEIIGARTVGQSGVV